MGNALADSAREAQMNNDQDYIRKAVEIAEPKFRMRRDSEGFVHYYGESDHEFIGTLFEEGLDQYLVDALAAELVRMVDAREDFSLRCYDEFTSLFLRQNGMRLLAKVSSEGRSMNSIKAIVDSGVLEK